MLQKTNNGVTDPYFALLFDLSFPKISVFDNIFYYNLSITASAIFTFVVITNHVYTDWQSGYGMDPSYIRDFNLSGPSKLEEG